MIRKHIQAVVVSLAALLAVSAIFAQAPQRPAKGAAKTGAQPARGDERAFGSITKVSGDTLTVKEAKGWSIVFKVESTATVTGYKEIKKIDLATGQWAIVEGKISADGSGIDATGLTVVAEQPPVSSRAPGVGMEVGQLTVTGDLLRLRTVMKEITVVANDQTQFHSRPKVAVGDLKVGDLVAVLGRDVAGENIATTVAVEPDAPTAKANAADLRAGNPAKADAKAAKAAGNPAKAGGKAAKANGANVGI